MGLLCLRQVSDLTGSYRLYRKECLDKLMGLCTSKVCADSHSCITKPKCVKVLLTAHPLQCSLPGFL